MNEEIKQKIFELENKIQSLDIERATLTKQLNTLKKAQQ